MSEQSKIEWTDATFNPWIGCTKVAAGCTRCYAEAFSKRTGKAKWGPEGTRIKTSPSYWKQPLKWNAQAEREGRRRRVFCASLADVFESWDKPVLHHSGELLLSCDTCGAFHIDDHSALSESCDCGRFKQHMDWATLDDVRRELFKLIDATPWLDWLLLTKRPESIRRMWVSRVELQTDLNEVEYRHNVWLGTSVATQADAERNLPLLIECGSLSPVLFMSGEPLLEEVSISDYLKQPWMPDRIVKPGSVPVQYIPVRGIDWVIVGGESGHGARPMHPAWARLLRDQCQAAGVAFLLKQWGEHVMPSQMSESVFAAVDKDVNLAGTPEQFYRVGKKAAGRLLDGKEWNEFPEVKHG